MWDCFPQQVQYISIFSLVILKGFSLESQEYPVGWVTTNNLLLRYSTTSFYFVHHILPAFKIIVSKIPNPPFILMNPKIFNQTWINIHYAEQNEVMIRKPKGKK